MCGIAGFCNMPENWHENICKMNNRMLHRGPDAEGIWSNEDHSVVLGHRRLSILDLSESGSQPMISASGRYVLVLNGEIYNFKNIKEKLLNNNKNISFKGTSDTEILLEAFDTYGMKATLNLTKGMFAVALYDREEKKLYLARDRMGEKPLYYGFIGDKFIFASDIASIAENLYFEDEIDHDALTLYFRYGYIPAPYTIYKNIRKLEAGSIAELPAPFTKIKEEKYWDIKEIAYRGQNHLFKGSREEASDELERLLKESVNGQMVADVPVGAFLSGGIDSTTVVAIMQKLAGEKIKTFTVGFENEAFNEATEAKKIAEYLGTDHTEIYITDKEAMEVIPQISHIYGEPFADSSQIPTYLVSKLARNAVTVSLSGDGGDELFCGYNMYNLIGKRWSRLNKIPNPLRAAAGWGITHTPLSHNSFLFRMAHYLKAENVAELYELTGNAVKGIDYLVLDGEIPGFKYNQYDSGALKNPKDNLMLMDMLMYHPDDILVKVDRSGMAVSLESRIPLLDRDIIEFAWSLPLSYKESAGVTKRVLRDVLYKYVPQDLMERPKKGFSVPIHEWLRRGELREWAEELLKSTKIRDQGILNYRVVEAYWNDFLKTGKWNIHIWYLLMFEQWYEKRTGGI